MLFRARSPPKPVAFAARPPCACSDRKGTNGVSANGVTAFFLFFGRGTFWILPLTYFYLPKSARAYPFPQSVRIHYFCSGPISVDPICPQQTYSRGKRPEIPEFDPSWFLLPRGEILLRTGKRSHSSTQGFLLHGRIPTKKSAGATWRGEPIGFGGAIDAVPILVIFCLFVFLFN